MAKQSNNKQTKQKTNSKSLEKKAENVTELGTRLASTPFQFMKRFGEEMDRLFEDFGFGRGWLTPAIERGIGEGLWAPQVEMFERDGQLVVRADLPGLTEADVNIELEDSVLTVSGERKAEHEERKEGYYRVERASGNFSRSLTLPEGIDPEKVQASFEHGVLEVRIPKPEQRKPRKVTISAGGGAPKTIEASETDAETPAAV